jgi:hypothetical protein
MKVLFDTSVLVAAFEVSHPRHTACLPLSSLIAGVNTSRDSAYRQMLAHGFRIEIIGVAMHRPKEPGYNRPDVFAIDDWR